MRVWRECSGKARSLSLQPDIANYVMYNTAFLVVFMDPCERDHFDNIVICTKKKRYRF
jgi:hypothetical protein